MNYRKIVSGGLYIRLEGIRLEARVGVLPEEHEAPQTIEMTVLMSPATALDDIHDRLENTVDYAAVDAALRTLALDRHRELIETLATDAATMIVRMFPVSDAEVEVRKFILDRVAHVAVGCSARWEPPLPSVPD